LSIYQPHCNGGREDDNERGNPNLVLEWICDGEIRRNLLGVQEVKENDDVVSWIQVLVPLQLKAI